MVNLIEKINILPDEKKDFLLNGLITHLVKSNQLRRLETILTNIFFLEIAIENRSVFELVRMFSKALNQFSIERKQSSLLHLIENALRQKINFAAKHPSMLFQILRNSCWDFNFPSPEGYYERKNDEPHNLSEIQVQEARKINTLLEKWEKEKTQLNPEFKWLRSLRPPPNYGGFSKNLNIVGHKGEILGTSVSSDGKYIATCCGAGLVAGIEDWTARVWDLESGENIVNFYHPKGVKCVSFTGNTNYLVSGSNDGIVRVWDIGDNNKPIHSYNIGGVINSIDVDRSSSSIFVTASDGNIHHLSFQGQFSNSIFEGPVENGLNSLKYVKNKKWIIYIKENSSIGILDVKIKENFYSQNFDKEVHILSLSKEENLLAALVGNSIKVLRISSFQFVNSITPSDIRISSLGLSHNGEFIILGSYDGAIQIISTESKNIIHSWQGHSATIRNVGFTEKPNIVYSTCEEELTLWNINKPLPNYSIHRHLANSIHELDFSPNVQNLLSITLDDGILEFNVNNGKFKQEIDAISMAGEYANKASKFIPSYKHLYLSKAWGLKFHDYEIEFITSDTAETICWLSFRPDIILPHPNGKIMTMSRGPNIYIYECMDLGIRLTNEERESLMIRAKKMLESINIFIQIEDYQRALDVMSVLVTIYAALGDNEALISCLKKSNSIFNEMGMEDEYFTEQINEMKSQ